ncbi:MAG: hypothetical protein FLDDKLPJ_02856 [Phycisphaerae bacterium]|nr:hypothetical protein [Phycisphaerae bacterium]
MIARRTEQLEARGRDEAGTTSATGAASAVRRFPYPYRAMLAICSDLDETPDARAYEQIMTYLNTDRDLGWGRGVGLEVGNTIYFDMPAGQFAYWSTDDRGRAMTRELMRSGHVDCLHSFGDGATTREHAKRALDELTRHDLRIEVWVDHAQAVTNFGADIMQGRGDVPGAEAYHADVTCDYGVQYVWRGRVTSVIGQDRPHSLRGVFDARDPAASLRTVGKEAVKHVLGRAGQVKYAMHGPNALVRPARLRDGRAVFEFIRCNPYRGGVERAATAAGIAEVLTDRFLSRLVERGGAAIVYTHLGKARRAGEPFEAATQAAFERLARYERAGNILVTTTRRLLGYRSAREAVIAAREAPVGGSLKITVAPGGPRLGRQDWQGLTVTLPAERGGRGVVGIEVEGVGRFAGRENPPDERGQISVMIPWERLQYPM